MPTLRPALLTLILLAAPLEAKHRRVAVDSGVPPTSFIVDSGLPADRIVQCLEADRAQPAVLRIDDRRRVLLGPNRGWIDVYAHDGASRLETRTEWVSGPAMERWATACAIGGRPPAPSVWQSAATTRASLKRLWPGSHRPS